MTRATIYWDDSADITGWSYRLIDGRWANELSDGFADHLGPEASDDALRAALAEELPSEKFEEVQICR